ENGSVILNETAEVLVEIVQGSTKVADLVGEISEASNEQAQGIAQINIGLDQIERVTQQNTSHAEETASVIEELAGQATQLARLVAQFKLDSREGKASGETNPVKSGYRLLE
ncbi:MAG: methyl-accepting chemotaxis protein, partial [Deltaproteobacteria bacterium]|nr:methyl-accepting chemotaxis protein [Deltaproteobacteria bacterium]